MYNEIKLLKVPYCQKILPLVYDESLSYYEAICKFQSKLNEIINVTNEFISGGIDEAIDKYFNNVMIDAIYDEQTETIILKKELIVGDGVHVYSAETKTMTISE